MFDLIGWTVVKGLVAKVQQLKRGWGARSSGGPLVWGQAGQSAAGLGASAIGEHWGWRAFGLFLAP